MDLRGPERLEKLLQSYRPTYICLETTQEDAKRRVRDHQTSQREAPSIRMFTAVYGKEAVDNILAFQNAMGYEIWVPHEYQQDRPYVQVRYLDERTEQDFQYARQKLNERVGEIVDLQGNPTKQLIEDLLKLDRTKMQQATDNSYLDTSAGIGRDFTQEEFEKFVIGSDDKVEPKLRYLFQTAQPDDVIDYVGGTLHIFGDYGNLFERLRDLNPQRVRLVEADKIEI